MGSTRLKNRILWISLFAISMGIFEGAVVIYIREIYYPNGFDFPLVPMNEKLALTEIIRELASLLMLVSVAWITGKNFTHRFAMFIYSFAVWDIVYYLFLWAILSWPESIMTWDILFLIPVMWTGPVLTPVIISFLMIVLALVIHLASIKKNFDFHLIKREWWLLCIGAAIVFTSFIWDFCRFLIRNISWNEISDKVFQNKLFDLSIAYLPNSFNWVLFLIGVGIIVFAIALISNRHNPRKLMDQFLEMMDSSAI